MKISTYENDFAEYMDALSSNFYKGHYHGAPPEWLPCDDEMYYYFLEVLPPMRFDGCRFSLSECLTHTEKGPVTLCFTKMAFPEIGRQYAACYLCGPALLEFHKGMRPMAEERP
jgi:hypothetical protein